MRAGDGSTVADIVARISGSGTAVEEGRVFVGKKRITSAHQPVRVGDAVRIGAPVTDAPRAIEILFREDDLIACVKPAGLPTVPDHAGASHSLVALVAKQLAMRPDDLRVTSRLDRDVSGVVVFATTDASETRLRSARDEGRYERRYVAIATPAPSGDRGTWDQPIGRAANPLLRSIDGLDAKPSTTRWQSIATIAAGAPQASFAMLAVDPLTGRTHQIRLHASAAGAPLVGDRDYGGLAKIVLSNGRVIAPTRIALHAARVVVPGIGRSLEAKAPIPQELTDLWSALGGQADAWDLAVTR